MQVQKKLYPLLEIVRDVILSTWACKHHKAQKSIKEHHIVLKIIDSLVPSVASDCMLCLTTNTIQFF